MKNTHIDNHMEEAHFFPYLDILRASAVLLVFIYHIIILSAWNEFPSGLLNIFRAGWVGVELFFILSGFVISISIDRNLKEYGKDNYKSIFLRKRIARIAPLYFLTSWCYLFLVEPTIFNAEVKDIALNLILHATFLHNLSPTYAGALNGSAWSIGVEMQFYLLIIIIYHWLPVSKPILVGMCGVVIAVLWRLAVWNLHPSDQSVHILINRTQQLPGTLDAFGLGGMLALLVINKQHVLHKFTTRTWRNFGATVSIAILLSVLCWIIFWPRSTYWNFPTMVVGFRLLLAITFLFWLWAVITIPFSKILNIISFPAIYIGEISYGIYLWHMMIIVSLLHAGIKISITSSLIMIAATVFISAFTWHFLELPIMRRVALAIKRAKH